MVVDGEGLFRPLIVDARSEQPGLTRELGRYGEPEIPRGESVVIATRTGISGRGSRYRAVRSVAAEHHEVRLVERVDETEDLFLGVDLVDRRNELGKVCMVYPGQPQR
jgi:hypothetical protein